MTLPDAANPAWVWYLNDCEFLKRTCRDANVLNDAWVTLLDWLNAQSSELGKRFVGEPLQSDPTLHGAGLHVVDPGGRLQSHLDGRIHPHTGLERRLNVVLFLNPVWLERWGGALEFYGDDGETVVHRVFPAFNRAVFFEPNEGCYHGVQRVATHAEPRITAAVNYFATASYGVCRKRSLFVPRRK